MRRRARSELSTAARGGVALVGGGRRRFAASPRLLASNILGPPRGTTDLFGDELRKHNFVVESARQHVCKYGFEEIQTPMFEHTAVFARSLGEGSDVVSKEMFAVAVDKSQSPLSLRPENTAGVVRAFLSKKDYGNLPQRYFYSGPMFRYERPQKGRSRQFHQIGVEVLGPSHPFLDVETIEMAHTFLHKNLNLHGPIELHINTLGSTEDRLNYKSILKQYLVSKVSLLSSDSTQRLERNAELRILDSKDPQDQEVLATAPVLRDFLSSASQKRFSEVTDLLKSMGIPFIFNPRLVRGLDYYCDTVFEFLSASDKLGRQQSTVLAGGRYDGLVQQMGGPEVAGIGWAAGVERLALLLTEDSLPTTPRPVALVYATSSAMTESERDSSGDLAQRMANYGFLLCQMLRDKGVPVHHHCHNPMQSLAKQLNRANKLTASHAVIIGEDELLSDEVTIKHLDGSLQQRVPASELVAHISAFRRATKKQL